MYVPTWFVNDFQDWLAKDRNKSLGSIAPVMHKALSSRYVLSGASNNNNYTGLLEILEKQIEHFGGFNSLLWKDCGVSPPSKEAYLYFNNFSSIIAN